MRGVLTAPRVFIALVAQQVRPWGSDTVRVRCIRCVRSVIPAAMQPPLQCRPLLQSVEHCQRNCNECPALHCRLEPLANRQNTHTRYTAPATKAPHGGIFLCGLQSMDLSSRKANYSKVCKASFDTSQGQLSKRKSQRCLRSGTLTLTSSLRSLPALTS